MEELEHFQEQQLAVISPLIETSRQLKAVAANIIIESDAELKEANQLKKDINAHGKKVKELRLELTRPLDDITKQLIGREREILEPLNEGKENISGKILAYEEEQERQRAAEAARIDAIANEILGHYRPAMTKNQVEQARVRGKRYIAELPAADAEHPRIKLALMTLSNKLTDRMTDIELDEQRDAKKKMDAKEAAVDAERRELQARTERERIAKQQLEADKAAARAERDRPKSNIAEITEFEITDPDAVSRELCSPDSVKIRAYIKQYPEAQPTGIRVFKTKKVR